MSHGTRLPHYLTARHTPPRLDLDNFNNVALRYGEVVRAHYPDDATNRSKREMEYTVNVQFRRGNGEAVNTLYHCTVADPFGSMSDSVRFTRRASKGRRKQDSLTDGATVLVACPNGQTGSAVIVSGVKHKRAPKDPVRAAGNYFQFLFNGVEASINDNGELALTVPGATKNDGSPDDHRDSNNKGTKIVVPMDGSVIIDNQAGDTIKIDTTNRRVFVGTKDMETDTEQTWTVSAGSDVLVEAGGNARVSAGGALRLGGSGASEPLVLGNSLTGAFQALLQTFTAGPIGIPGPGGAIGAHPAFVARLIAWAAQYATPASPFLASNKFTEK